MSKKLIIVFFAIINSIVSMAQSQVQEDVAFKVQVGAFRENVPVELADVFIKIAHKELNNYKDDKGVNIYTLGNFKTYEEAAKLKLELAQNYGMKDAFVVAYKNGKKVPVSEVRK